MNQFTSSVELSVFIFTVKVFLLFTVNDRNVEMWFWAAAEIEDWHKS
jgi:hypothetical protein